MEVAKWINQQPIWTLVDKSQAYCGACHGIPPLPPHPPSYDCVKCHPSTITEYAGLDVDGGYHINGKGDVRQMLCNTCHGSEISDAPPASTLGATDTSDVTVGAHQSHLVDNNIRRAVACEDCHVVPESVEATGHMDSPPAEVTFSALATTGSPNASWDRVSATCTDVYCHGATLGGGTNNVPEWTDTSGSQTVCGTCHGLPPPAPHPEGDACVDCHVATVDADYGLTDKHINGVVEANEP